jgi:hypothetical protein
MHITIPKDRYIVCNEMSWKGAFRKEGTFTVLWPEGLQRRFGCILDVVVGS